MELYESLNRYIYEKDRIHDQMPSPEYKKFILDYIKKYGALKELEYIPFAPGGAGSTYTYGKFLYRNSLLLKHPIDIAIITVDGLILTTKIIAFVINRRRSCILYMGPNSDTRYEIDAIHLTNIYKIVDLSTINEQAKENQSN